MSAEINTEILIIGAGPAGAGTALFLAKQGIPCVLTDKAAFPRDKICGDALSGKVVEVLKKLDPAYLEELYTNEKFLGSWGVTFVSPDAQSLRVPFSKKDAQSLPPGFIAKRFDFDNWLFQKAKAHPLITTYESVEIRNYERTNQHIIAHTKEGIIFRTQLVIACDGAHSSFAKNIAGIKTEAAHNCFGLRAYYKGVSGLDAENFIELHFIKDVLPGYLWIFPLPNGEANVGIGMRADKLNKKKINLKKTLEKALAQNDTLRERFSKAELLEEVKLYGLPLGSQKRKLSGKNYILCGDAAQLIDPFTGEGIGNALMSGSYAAAQAARCIKSNNFSESFMQQYDCDVYTRLWSELQLSYRLQQLVNFPSLFNFVVRKANSNQVLQETISCMFEDMDMRARLKTPAFYFKLLFS